MKRVLSPLAAACLLAFLPSHASASPYSGMVVFGDSLSDAGQRPEAGAATNPVRHTNRVGPGYAAGEAYGYTSPMLINNLLGLGPQTASTNLINQMMGRPDGDNWAVGGYTTAQILESIVGTHDTGTGYGGSEVRAGLTPADPLIRGRDGYLPSLRASGRSIDPNTLFYVNGGGNDFLANISFPGILTPAYVTNAASNMDKSLRALQAAGGRYFMVPLLVDVMSPANGGVFDPHTFEMSQLYNSELIRHMANLDAEVIPLNVPLLYREVLANRGAFGFDTSMTELQILSSCFADCGLAVHPVYGATGASPDPSKLLYADIVHPTVAMQQILSHQAYSILSAPWEISLLPEMADGSLRASQDLLRTQLQADWADWQQTGSWRGFVSGSGQHRNFKRADTSASGDGNSYGVHMGASYRLTDVWRVGLAASLQEQEMEVGAVDSKYKMRSYLGSAFAEYHDGFMWFDGNLTAGYLDYHDLKRKFAMGITTRTEKGDTDGYVAAIGGRLGVELGVADEALKLSPFISADFSRIQVDAYDESGASSTALSYDRQTRESKRLGVGVQARYQFTQATAAFGEISREKEFNDDMAKVGMELNSVRGVDFELKGYNPGGNLTRFSLGAEHQLSDGLALRAGYNYRHQSDDNQHGANLSLVMAF